MKEVLAGREGQLERSIARELNRGLQSVRALVTEHNIQGVHGTLMELFECPGEREREDLWLLGCKEELCVLSDLFSAHSSTAHVNMCTVHMS